MSTEYDDLTGNLQALGRSYTREALGDEAYAHWHRLVQEELESRDLHWYIMLRDTTGSFSALHIPPEFTDRAAEPGEPYEKRDPDERPYCGRTKSSVTAFKYKPRSAFPPGSRDICSYCLYEFVHWHCRDHE